MTIYNFIALFGGLAFFLFGMNVMSANLEKMAGGKLEGVLRKMTSNPFKSLMLGAVITIAIQSSSAFTVMLVGLVNSNIMELSQTVVTIMGSDIGTTLTAWILSLNGIETNNVIVSFLKPENFSLIVALIGVVMTMACRSEKKKDIGTIFCGFGVLMYGMSMMSASVAPLADMPQFQNLLIAFDNPFLGLLMGVAFTGVIQSSAASIGVLQALSLTGSISLGMAVPLIMGANIGTCVTAVISGIGVSRKAKRVPVIHVSIKILGTIIWMAVYLAARYLLSLDLFSHTVSAFQIAVFHTVFNIGTIVVLLPFSKKIVKLAEKILPVPEDEYENHTVLLDERLLVSPGLAVAQCRERTVEMANLARNSFIRSLSIFDDYNEKAIDEVIAMEQRLDELEDKLNDFLSRIAIKPLTQKDNNAVSEMLHCINDFERIGDHAINMTKTAGELRENENQFSNIARGELGILSKAVSRILAITLKAFENDDSKTASYIEPLEEVIDDLVKEIKSRHIQRIRDGICSGDLGILINDFLTNCERVSDHCSNVGVCIIQTGNSSYDTHGYLHEVKYGGEASFTELFDEYKDIYHLLSLQEEAVEGPQKIFDGSVPDPALESMDPYKMKEEENDKFKS